MSISKVCVKRPVATFMVMLICMSFGMLGMVSLKMDLMPNMNIPYAIVMTTYDGAGPEEIEKLITKPIERTVSSVSGLKEMQSQSVNGSSVVMIEFTSDTDIDSAAQNLRERVDLIKSTLPKDAKEPMIMQIDINSMIQMELSASSESMDASELKEKLDNDIVPRLERVKDVGSVTTSGGREKEIHVVVNAEKVRGYGLSESGIASIIAAENINTPLGTIGQGTKDLTLRVKGEYASIEEIKQLPLTTAKGSVIRLSDVADVSETYADTSSVAYTNGKESVNISVGKQSTGNTVTMSDGVQAELKKIQEENPDISFLVISDPADYIKKALTNVVDSLVKGALLAVVILYIFLRNMKSTLIAAVSMPVSVVFTFAAMKVCGVNFNMMSLGGLTLGVGMLVDNSIVVMESIFQKLEKGIDSYEAATEGAREVTNSVIASTLTNVVVFLPITFMGGTAAEMFNDFCLTIIFSVVSSVVVALTFVPMACNLILKPEDIGERKSRTIIGKFFDIISGFIDAVRSGYGKALRLALHHRTITIAIAVAFVIFGCVIAFTNLEMVLMPDADQSEISVTVDMPTGTKIEETEKMALLVADRLDDVNEVTDVSISMGGSGLSSAIMGSSADSATITISTVPKTERDKSTKKIASDMRKLVQDIAGADIEITAVTSSMGNYSSNGLEIDIYGDDNATIKKVATDFMESIKTVPGVVDAETSFSVAAPQTTISIDRDKAALYGVSAANVAAMLRTDISGTTATTYKVNDDEYDIIVMQDKDKINYLADVESILIPTATGTSIPLSDVAVITTEDTPTQITRDNQSTYGTVTANFDGVSATTTQATIKQLLDKKELPNGVTWKFGGTEEQRAENFSSLGLALIVGIFMLYMVMAAEFESLTMPAIVLMALPVGMTAALLGCLVMGEPLSMTSIIGLIVLAGVGVNNAIVLVDYANLLAREQGLEYTEAMAQSGPSRFRPVLMSTLTTVIAMIPMLVSRADGSEQMKGLAITEVFGLMTATVVTLFLIPAIYSKYHSHLDKKRKRKEKRVAKRAAKKAALANK